jgi:hypothetical protein
MWVRSDPGRAGQARMKISATAIRTLLRRSGLGPAPRRSGPTWGELFNQAHGILATDFFTVESIWLRTHVIFVIELHTRRVHMAGATRNPDSAWITQQGRNLSFDLTGGGSFRVPNHGTGTQSTPPASTRCSQATAPRSSSPRSPLRGRISSPNDGSGPSGPSASTGSACWATDIGADPSDLRRPLLRPAAPRGRDLRTPDPRSYQADEPPIACVLGAGCAGRAHP